MDGIHLLPPLSPLGQFINTPTLTFYIMGVLELENPFTKSQVLKFLKDDFIPLNIRFSSLILTDEKGVQRWKKIDCVVEDHLVVPTFIPTSNDDHQKQEYFDDQLEEYISDINMKELPLTRPPWQVHLITYPTKNAKGSLVFKLNHALGDGYSFMGSLFSIFKSADNPSIPLKFPSASSRMNQVKPSYYSKASSLVTKCKNTFFDLSRNILGAFWLEDGKTVIRSVTPRIEHQPISITSITISLDNIRDVRNKVGGTVNDVTTGLIAYGCHLYMKKLGECGDGSYSITALTVMNMRMYRGYKNLEEMLKANIWGNHFGLLSVSLPSFISSETEKTDPLDFILKAKEEMERKANSLGAYFTGKFINIIGMIKGPEGGAQFIHSNVKNKSIFISNMCGPIQKAAIAGNPLKSFYFTIPGVPQSLIFTIVSYMGKLRLVTTSEKGFIDAQLMNSCLKEGFQKIYFAACGKNPIDD